MAQSRKLKESDRWTNGKGKERRAERLARRARRQAKRDFKDKVFADLTDEEKGDLLKALAIAAGIIEE